MATLSPPSLVRVWGCRWLDVQYRTGIVCWMIGIIHSGRVTMRWIHVAQVTSLHILSRDEWCQGSKSLEGFCHALRSHYVIGQGAESGFWKGTG